MEPHTHRNGDTPYPIFPSLPIVTPDLPQKTTAEKYGGLFYLGIAGLVIMVGLVGWFSWGVWSLRSVWTNIYILNDSTRPDSERNQAAYELSRDPQVNARQRWDLALTRTLPPIARYLIAESILAEAAETDPRGYVLAVSRSEGWPDWLRVLLAEPIAYATSQGRKFPRDPLVELSKNPDPAVALWATFSLARIGDVEAFANLRTAAKSGPYQEMAIRLIEALETQTPANRTHALDAATLWLRDHHPGAIKVWTGWSIRGGRVVSQ